MILQAVVVGSGRENCYVLAAARGSEAVIIDPGAEEGKIRRVIEKNALRPALVVNTHGHYDHIGCNDSFCSSVYIHSKDMPFLTDPKLNLSWLFGKNYVTSSAVKPVKDGDIIGCSGIKLEVIHVPGHTPGGIALLLREPDHQNILFSGDSLFNEGIGRADFPGSDPKLLVSSIKERLLTLPESTRVYPGHGPATTIGKEKKTNPFLS